MQLNKIFGIIIAVGLIFPLFSYNQQDKIILNKITKNRNIPKIHPFTSSLSNQANSSENMKKSANYDKLLVLLVDFQEDEDTNTTGNGKFLTQVDPTYAITLGSPPHNLEFYNYQLEALKYYYRAVSYEAYQLNYDIYPKNTQAYTLPHKMSYYNPGVQNQDLFVSRVEEYFKDVFETADQDSLINFGDYGHYMIIHAGSDWQHDVLGDSPNDLPSFFIKVGDGKEVWVDNHQTMITHVCNVPETITQDIQTEVFDDNSSSVSGYGVINGVIAHEFGHSLGLVDLYNVRNFHTEVGTFDIMDSGGQGQGSDYDNATHTTYTIEGVVPCLPGAWSRYILFKDDFINRGILKEINTKIVDFDKDLKIQAVESKYNNFNIIPKFYQLPLNENEFLLLENRSVDPDGDGGMAIKSALDYRIALYPSPTGSSNEFTYEYDWMLPSWVSANNNAYGGGLLIWHIDNNRLYNTGITDTDGQFYSNFEQNTVNTIHSKRSVQVVEADNIQDIGNDSSWYWTGTPYEYFFKYKPNLDSLGTFIGWLASDDNIFNDSLSAVSKPELKMNNGKPSNWVINHISQAKNNMTFRISNLLFNRTSYLTHADTIYSVSPISHSSNGIDSDLLIINSNMTFIYNHNLNNQTDNWDLSWKDTFNVKPMFPIVRFDINDDNSDDFIILKDKKLHMIINNEITEKSFNTDFVDTPILIKKEENYLVASTSSSTEIFKCLNNNLLSSIYSISDHGFLASDDSDVYILSKNKLVILFQEQNNQWNKKHEFLISDQFTIYHPVLYKSEMDQSVQIFMMSDSGVIWTLRNNQISRIFNIKDFNNEIPSEMALMIDETGYLSIVLGSGNEVFRIFRDGSFAANYPIALSNQVVKPLSNITIFKKEGVSNIIFNDQNSGLFSIDQDGELDYSFTMYWDKGNIDPIWYHEQTSNRLYSVFNDRCNNIYASWLAFNEEDSLIWNGYKNTGYSLLKGTSITPIIYNEMQAYVYPNPVKEKSCRIRVENSKSNFSTKIYNISGDLIVNKMIQKSTESYQDIQINTDKFSSGVYFAIIKDNSSTKKIKFAVIK